MPQGINRVEVGRALGGIQPEDQSYRHADAHREQQTIGGDHRGHVGSPKGEDTAERTDDPPGDAGDQCGENLYSAAF